MTLIVRDSDDYRYVRGTLAGADPGVIAAAGDYGALDVLSNDADDTEGAVWTFTNAARNAGGTVEIHSVLTTLSADAMAHKLRIHLFNAIPTGSEADDNAAGNIVIANRNLYVGLLDLTADSLDLGTVNVGQLILATPLKVRCAAGSRNLYGIAQTVDAETGEAAGMTMTIQLMVK